MRAAVLLVLLADLQERLDGGNGVLDILHSIEQVYRRLEQTADSRESVLQRLRMALYRVDLLLGGEEFLPAQRYCFRYNSHEGRLKVLDGKTAAAAGSVVFDITSASPELSQSIDSLLSSSLLARVRKSEALFLAPGNDSHDRLLLELFDHGYPVTETSLFGRPLIQSHPVSVLEKIGASANKIRRTQVVHEGYASGRIKVTEIISRVALWSAIEVDADGRFTRYPAGITQADVCEHLEFMQFLLESYPTYELVLADGDFNFPVGLFELFVTKDPELYTLFVTAWSGAKDYQPSSVAMKHPAVNRAMQESVVGWLLSRNSTVRARHDVVDELKQIRKHLLSSGPAGHAGPAPKFALK